jgi:hypothetical protein
MLFACQTARRFTDEPVAEIVRGGEPIFLFSFGAAGAVGVALGSIGAGTNNFDGSSAAAAWFSASRRMWL